MGGKATFKVTATNVDSYQWYYRTSATGAWTAVTEASGKTATYSFTAATQHNGCRYRCLLENTYDSVYTNTVTLSVTKKTGWVSSGGRWYYLNSSGVMQTGWVKVSNKWYYINSSGVRTNP